jgi:uncharacterized DUF497 family protein
VYVWDENKREANLVKHGLDFADSALVYENPDKLTLISTRQREKRYADSPLVQLAGSCLTLVYIERGIDIDPPRDENGRALPVPGSRTDWDRVRHTIATDAHIPYDP